MEELIKITENEKGVKLVSAKELYQYLEIKTDFSDWCKRMFAYGFDEGKDFTSFLGESNGGRPSTDYALTIDTAKEISMLQRTRKGKEARKYFIEMEKIAKGLLNPILSRLQMSEYWFQAETKIIQLAQKIEQDAQVTRWASSRR